jgi:hypothetical protein
MVSDKLKLTLKQRWERMHLPRIECTYYALTLTADAAGKINWSSQSSFVGWEDSKRRWELRGPRSLTAAFSELWKSLDQPFVFVHSSEDLFIFLLSGGNGLIEKAVAEERLKDLLQPVAVAPSGFAGFKTLSSVEPAALKRNPTPKIRMKVLTRDDRRCRICGRRPDDDVDLELHVHHIRPSGNGGLSETENLITLCDTCHTGLDPHEDWSLFDFIPESAATFDTESNLRELMEGVARYRMKSLAAYRESAKQA